eukprot:4139543-Alexandrium_andersonii.AAC.1
MKRKADVICEEALMNGRARYDPRFPTDKEEMYDLVPEPKRIQGIEEATLAPRAGQRKCDSAGQLRARGKLVDVHPLPCP